MPPRYHLPSGAQVELGAGEPLELEGPFSEELRGVRARLSVPLGELPLGDLQVIRAIVRKLGLVAEKPVALRCSNCHAELHVKPCAGLELGPFLDGELDDPAVDEAFDFGRTYAIPALDAEAGGESTLRLAPRSVGEVGPFHGALSPERPLRITSGVVRGMGIVELDGETDPRKIARRLASAPDAAFDAVGALFEDAHYPLRLDVPHPCPSCGVTEWLSVPLSRELSLEPAGAAAPAPPDDQSFMDPDEFEALVRQEAEAAYADLGVKQIDLSVIEGPAEVDDGGEPLLGCYRPPDPEGLVPRPAEIRLFYRTFANIAHDDGPYDVRAEVRETIRHELEHHFGHLSGDDPLDDEEHAEIHREQARRVGQRELERRAVRSFWAELRTFFARTWLVWLIAAVVTLLAVLAESR